MQHGQNRNNKKGTDQTLHTIRRAAINAYTRVLDVGSERKRCRCRVRGKRCGRLENNRGSFDTIESNPHRIRNKVHAIFQSLPPISSASSMAQRV